MGALVQCEEASSRGQNSLHPCACRDSLIAILARLEHAHEARSPGYGPGARSVRSPGLSPTSPCLRERPPRSCATPPPQVHLCGNARAKASSTQAADATHTSRSASSSSFESDLYVKGIVVLSALASSSRARHRHAINE